MSCPSNHRLAAASVGEDIDAELHAETCETCRAELAAMAAVVAIARRAPVPKLTADRRAMLEAAVMAESDAAPVAPRIPPHRFTRVAAFAALAAAVVAIVMWPDRPESPVAIAPTPPAASVAHPEAAPSSTVPTVPTVAVAPDASSAEPAPGSTPAPAPPAQVAVESPTTAAQITATHLSDGPVTIDARNAAPVRIAAGDTAVKIAASKVEVTAHGGVVTMVRVFAGSAEVVHTGRRVVVVAGDVWVRPTAAAEAMQAFAQGWIALRTARYRSAIAAFDRAANPVIAEDAAYWAAVAAGRAGARADAARRLRSFMLQFPRSHRLDDARRRLEELQDGAQP